MRSAVKLAVLGIAVVIISAVFWDQIQSALGQNNSVMAVSSITGSQSTLSTVKSDDGDKGKISIAEKWELPEVLKEISGISYIGDNKLAVVQDELGKIFIYNTQQQQIEKELSFGPPGDYEGIALVGSTAYVLRSDGTLIEVQQYNGKKPDVKHYNTHLTAEHDLEGLCYDAKEKRLLLAIKGTETHTDDYKGIYAFDLTTKNLSANPVYKIDLTHKALGKTKKKKAAANPTGIAIHPSTGDLYITSTNSSKLLVMDQKGNLKNVYTLEESDFQQPEGITFTDKDELLVSNEGGKKGAGNILKIKYK